MFSVKMLPFWCVLVVTAAFLASLGGCGGGGSSTTPPPPPSQKIQHVVVIFQENRTPDNLFQDQNLVTAGADIQNYGMNSAGQKITLTPTTMATSYDLSHAHKAFVDMYDNGKMDGADKIPVQCSKNAPPPCPKPNVWFQYVEPSEVAPYFQLAETYTFADRMFQTNQGPSFPAHQYIISGTSAPSVGSNLFVAENPLGGPSPFYQAGCIAPPQETVALIDPSGGESQNVYPCFDHPTLTDMLNAANISWRYYTPSAGIIWNAPNAIEHMCVPNAPPPNGTKCTGSDWTNNVVLNSAQVLTDISNNQLASVSWVIPTGQESDHANVTDGTGPSWVASVVNAIGNSQYWSNTAIFIAWDDWGGWYDHVAPTVKNSYEYGFRVPLIVVSPYARAQYVSHVPHHFGSILKYIEENFGLGSLGYADADADDLSDCFDYTQTPLTFQTIKASMNAQHFLEDKRPPADPDDD
ncbi:MAG: alkaline phosphatase family protein [Terriglobales bacterium]